jgi:hypothetical protein
MLIAHLLYLLLYIHLYTVNIVVLEYLKGLEKLQTKLLPFFA